MRVLPVKSALEPKELDSRIAQAPPTAEMAAGLRVLAAAAAAASAAASSAVINATVYPTVIVPATNPR
jgi:hypothetical protein